MFKSSDVSEPRYKVIIFVAPIIPLSLGPTVLVIDNHHKETDRAPKHKSSK